MICNTPSSHHITVMRVSKPTTDFYLLRSDSITSDPLASEARLYFSLKGPLRLRFRPGPSFLLHPQLCNDVE
jgi:hypothetical protein